MLEYEQGFAARAANDPDDKLIKSGVNPDNIRKWTVLKVGLPPRRLGGLPCPSPHTHPEGGGQVVGRED